jgi:hypothetical protein
MGLPNGLRATLGVPDPVACGIFLGGSGGGISILFARPDYQETMPGLRHSEHSQTYVVDGKLIYSLPGSRAQVP